MKTTQQTRFSQKLDILGFLKYMFGMGISMLRIKGLQVGSIWISTIKAVHLTPIKVNDNKKCHKSHR